MTTATTTTVAKKSKSGICVKVADIDALVKFLAANNVKRFKHGDLEIEIDTIVNATRDESTESLDQKAKTAASLFAETPEDQEADMFWSTSDIK